MSEKLLKHYIFASDFDQTLSFNDSGLVLSERLGIPADEFARKASGMARLDLVQRAAESAYPLLDDPPFRRVGGAHFLVPPNLFPLTAHMDRRDQTLARRITGCH